MESQIAKELPGMKTNYRAGHRTSLSVAIPAVVMLVVLSEPLLGQTSSGQYGASTTAVTAGVLIVLTALSFNGIRFKASWISLFIIYLLGVVSNGLHEAADVRQVLKYLLILVIICLTFVLTRYAVQKHESAKRRMDGTFRLVVIAGLAFSLPALLAGEARISGFRASSPTLFSYALAIAICVLLWRGKGLIDIFLVVAAAWMIYLTGTRTTILLVALILVLYVTSRGTKVMARFGWTRSAITVVLGALCIVSLVPTTLIVAGFGSSSVLQYFDELSQRAAAGDSTRTRSQFYSVLLQELRPSSLLTGNGAGRAFDAVSAGSGKRVAPHMDLLAVTVDFGIPALLGILMLFVQIVLKAGLSSGATAVVVAYLVSGQFHNVLFSPPAVLLTVIALAIMLPAKYGTN